jgi:hypothetical protein
MALVDADQDNYKPHNALLKSPDIQIIVASSPKNRNKTKWLKQGASEASVYAMDLWTVAELFVAGFSSSICYVTPFNNLF